ncbi:solute carrier family 35 member G1 [Chironomus tepperi]|uniref:solute carrier family 35 member G1 n=1 Tax=Chironomus tepperi TaxID=113505 RepID=UPI00391F7DCE
MAVKVNQFLGIIFGILSSLCFSLCSVIAKYLIEISPVELTLYRFIGIFLPSLSIAIYRSENVFPDDKRDKIALFLRCFIGTTGLMLNFYAVQNMNLGDSSVIIYSTPVFVAIFSKIFLNEPCSLFNCFNIALSMVGIVFIIQPNSLFNHSSSSSTSSLWGPVAAILSAIFGSNVIIILRILKHLHHSVIMSNTGIFAILYTLIVLMIMNEFCSPCSFKERVLIVGLAVFSYFGQMLLTVSLQFEEPNVVSMTRSTIVLFSFIWQILFFDEILSASSLFGAFLIILSNFLNAFLAVSKQKYLSNKFLRLIQF